jgi:hypothetical protein
MGNLQRKLARLDNAVPRRRRSISGCDGPADSPAQTCPSNRPKSVHPKTTARKAACEQLLASFTVFFHRIFYRTGIKHD